MEKIRTVGSTLRNHWKKSVFLTVAGGYGGNWYWKKLQDNDFMRKCCREALTYGATPIGVHQQNYHVTVVLNPAASGGKARKLFEQYSAPLLHLAGFKVSIQKTEGREEAKELLKIMENCDAVLIAGGDGTLMEAVTGVMKREDKENFTSRTPLGIIPLGTKNSLANTLFPSTDQVRQLAESTMAVIRQIKRPVSVIEVENLSTDEFMRGKKLFGTNSLEMGAWREADARKDNYWFFAGLKHRMTYVFSYLTGHKEVMWDWPISVATLKTEKLARHLDAQPSPPPTTQRRGGFAGFFSSPAPKPEAVQKTEEIVESWQEPVRMEAGQVQVNMGTNGDELNMKIFPNNSTFSEFVSEGWCRINKDSTYSSVLPEVLTSTQFKLDTFSSPENPRLMTVDGEEVELTGPIRISVLPNVLTMFCGTADAAVVDPSTQPTQPPPAQTSRWSTPSVTSQYLSGTNFKTRI